jgi:hypothetical protein
MSHKGVTPVFAGYGEIRVTSPQRECPAFRYRSCGLRNKSAFMRVFDDESALVLPIGAS